MSDSLDPRAKSATNRPPDATTRALMDCVDFLSQMKFYGWAEETLPDLERLWWRYHDADGKWRGPEAKESG